MVCLLLLHKLYTFPKADTLELPCDLLNGSPNPVPPTCVAGPRSPRGRGVFVCVGLGLSWINNLLPFPLLALFNVATYNLHSQHTPWHPIESSCVYCIVFFVTCYCILQVDAPNSLSACHFKFFPRLQCLKSSWLSNLEAPLHQSSESSACILIA